MLDLGKCVLFDNTFPPDNLIPNHAYASIVAAIESFNPGKAFGGVSSPLFNEWKSSLLIFLLFLGLLLVVLCNSRSIASLTRHLMPTAVIIWFLGIILYMIGFNDGGCENNAVALILRSALSSMEMFVSHSDLIEVKHELHEEYWYMTPFAVVHFCAALISAIFILRLLGLRVTSWLRVWWWYFRSCFEKHTAYYVFWSVDRNSVRLAKTLPAAGRRIIFIDQPDSTHARGARRFSFSHFFHSGNDKVNQYIDEIEDMGALLFNAERTFSDPPVEMDRLGKKRSIYQVFDHVGLPCLGRILDRIIGDKKLEFFFLSEDESENISSIIALKTICRDCDESHFANFKCYCHARKNEFNRALLRHGAWVHNIHLIDSSSLSVLQLKKEGRNHPVRYVDVDSEKGIVRTPFVGLVIGFGETGRDAFRFLYEFSSFVRDDEGQENPKTIHVVDSHLNELKADFLKNKPALEKKSSDVIDWWDDVPSTYSAAFWHRLQDVVRSLNYVVIAVGNDEEGASLATEIYDLAYRFRTDLNRFGIYVRLRDSRKTDFIRNEATHIFPFGADNDIFNYDILSVDMLERQAVRFYYQYQERAIGLTRQNLEKDRAKLHELESKPDRSSTEERDLNNSRKRVRSQEAWIDGYRKIVEDSTLSAENKMVKLWRFRQHYILSDLESGGCPTREDYTRLEYQEEQDRSNAWHVITKRMLVNDQLPKGWKTSRLMVNLGNCEHLRWVSRMELSGFVWGKNPDCRERRHPCMVDCQTLKTDHRETIPYDWAVVEESFFEESEKSNENKR